MPMKEILYKFQPFQLYLVLTITCLYFLIQLILSQTTHSITLLVACYQSLCNVIALTGNLLTRKVSAFLEMIRNFLLVIELFKYLTGCWFSHTIKMKFYYQDFISINLIFSFCGWIVQLIQTWPTFRFPH